MTKIPEEVKLNITDPDEIEITMRRAVGLLKKLVETNQHFHKTISNTALREMRFTQERAIEFLIELNSTN